MPDLAFDDFGAGVNAIFGDAVSGVLQSVVVAFLRRQNRLHAANSFEHTLGTVSGVKGEGE